MRMQEKEGDNWRRKKYIPAYPRWVPVPCMFTSPATALAFRSHLYNSSNLPHDNPFLFLAEKGAAIWRNFRLSLRRLSQSLDLSFPSVSFLLIPHQSADRMRQGGRLSLSLPVWVRACALPCMALTAFRPPDANRAEEGRKERWRQ